MPGHLPTLFPARWIDLSPPFLSDTGLLGPVFIMLLNLTTRLCGSAVQPDSYSCGMLISHLVILSLLSGPRDLSVV